MGREDMGVVFSAYLLSISSIASNFVKHQVLYSTLFKSPTIPFSESPGSIVPPHSLYDRPYSYQNFEVSLPATTLRYPLVKWALG
jgi:hypothetical protein